MLPSSRSLFLSVCVAIPFSLIWTVSSAQYGQAAKGVDITKWKATKFQGKIDSVSGGTLTALNFGNDRIFLYIAPQFTKQVSIKGTAEPSAIKSGMGIRFAGKVDSAGLFDGTLSELYLTTPDESLAEFSLDEDAEIEGVIVSNDTKGNLKVNVNGVKSEMKGEKTIILKRLKVVTVKIADDVKVNVDVRDTSMVRKDDAVSVTGRIVKSNNADQPNHIVCESLIVEMAQPFSGKKPARTSETAAAKKEKKDDGKANPFEEGAKQAEENKPAVPPKKVETPKKADAGKKIAQN